MPRGKREEISDPPAAGPLIGDTRVEVVEGDGHLGLQRRNRGMPWEGAKDSQAVVIAMALFGIDLVPPHRQRALPVRRA